MFQQTVCNAVVLLGLLTVSVPAQITLTLTSSADGTLYQDATGSLANGSGTLFFSGLNANSTSRRGILAFDVSSIPPGSFVCSASLQLTAVATTNNGPSSLVLYRVLGSWGEGPSVAGGAQGGGGAAQPGDATWLHTFYPSALWTAAGGDMVAVASGLADVSAPGTYHWTDAGLALDVQAWVDGSSANNGWILRSPETVPQSMKHFGTREHPTAANRPQLTVTFHAGATASVTPIGPACPQPPGSLLTLSASALPTIPSPLFGLAIGGGPAGGAASIYVSPALASPATTLPNNCLVLLDLAGVTALINAGVSPLGPLVLDPAGSAFLPIPIPNTPCIGGTQVALQALTVDPQFAGGFAVSNALALVVGH